MKNHLRKSPGNVPDGHQKIEPKTARTLLVIAAALLIIALAWRFFLEKNSFSGGIVRSLAQHGCNIEADELYKHNFAKNTSIRALVGDTDMTRAADASRECGFDADIDKTGDVYVLLANLGDEQVLIRFRLPSFKFRVRTPCSRFRLAAMQSRHRPLIEPCEIY